VQEGKSGWGPRKGCGHQIPPGGPRSAPDRAPARPPSSACAKEKGVDFELSLAESEKCVIQLLKTKEEITRAIRRKLVWRAGITGIPKQKITQGRRPPPSYFHSQDGDMRKAQHDHLRRRIGTARALVWQKAYRHAAMLQL